MQSEVFVSPVWTPHETLQHSNSSQPHPRRTPWQLHSTVPCWHSVLHERMVGHCAPCLQCNHIATLVVPSLPCQSPRFDVCCTRHTAPCTHRLYLPTPHARLPLLYFMQADARATGAVPPAWRPVAAAHLGCIAHMNANDMVEAHKQEVATLEYRRLCFKLTARAPTNTLSSSTTEPF